ncbi:glycosyl transferase [Vibrio fluvialis]|nr:glycosyl transferase [Vibrio fluvialis]
MSNKYNPFERSIAKALSKFPFIKKTFKVVYSRLNYIFNKPGFEVESKYKIKEVGEFGNETFFGYYDKSPVNNIGLTLCCSTSSRTKLVPTTERLTIFVLDNEGKSLCSVDTFTYNWQQGPRCFWLNDDLFIFNDFNSEEQKYCSKVFSVTRNEIVSVYELPVQDAYKDSFMLSINYQRLMTLRPDYGYRNLENLNENELKDLCSDGIWKLDLLSGVYKLIVSLDNVVNFKPKTNYSVFNNKVNHIMISPNGDKFIFIHRYLKGKQRFDRLILSDIEGNLIKVLADNDMVSHCNWLSNREIVGYFRGTNGKDSYYKLNVVDGMLTEVDIAKLRSFGDGHPSRIGNWVVTDSYPDKSRIQTLYMFNIDTKEVKILAELFHGFSFDGETRCDLHPRVSMDEKRVYFDTVSSGKRKLAYIELPHE